MLQMTRKAAIEAGDKTYFTGVECRNGHLAERHTASGTCKGCLSDSYEGVRRAIGGPRVDITPERQAQRAALEETKLRAVPADAATLLDTVAAVTLARHPALDATDVVGPRKGVKPAGGTLQYIVHVDPLDKQLLRDMQNAMLDARAEPVEKIRRRAFGALAAQADAARDNGEGEWKFT